MNTTSSSSAAPEHAPAVTSAPPSVPAPPTPKKSPKLPLKEVTIRPNTELRLKILKISHETGMSAPVVLERLVAQAAGLKVTWIVVRPQFGSDVGVSLQRIAATMEQVYIAIRNAKGLIASHGTDQQRRVIDEIYARALELSALAEALAKGTMYNHDELVRCRQVFNRVSSWRRKALKELAEEQSKGADGDSEKIHDCNIRQDQFATAIEVLKRLGFSPEGLLP